MLDSIPPVYLDIPADQKHGEFSCNIALQLAGRLKRKPLDIAKEIKEPLQKKLSDQNFVLYIEELRVEPPGFLNVYLSSKAFWRVLEEVLLRQESYGESHFGQNVKVQVEFVSANPTGPLSVAHARQAAVGDALVNIFNCAGFDAKREYYVNDEGNQINLLGRSIQLRALEWLGEDIAFPQEGYQGDYVKTIAQEFCHHHGLQSAKAVKDRPLSEFSRFGVDTLMKIIQKI